MSGEENLGPGEAGAASGSGRFHILQPNRDLESNWAVDVAKNLEEYLLKICSGEITADDQDQGHHSVNFAEAALLLQGSIQVYSRKVEYLYSLVLHALEFISQKRQNQNDNSSIQPDGTEANAVVDEDNENFLGLDDVPVDAKNCIDDGPNKDDTLNHFMKPPANLLVLEGDCLDSSGDAGELGSYLLSTCDIYGDFLLLDPCDAGAIYNFLKGKSTVNEPNVTHRGSSVRSRTRSNFISSPAGKSGGNGHRASLGKDQDVDLNQTTKNNFAFETGEENQWVEPNIEHDFPGYDMHHGEEPDIGCSDVRDQFDSDEDDDPWKPLNPHEPGYLKIKPFKKGKISARKFLNPAKRNVLTSQFPLAKLDGTVSPEYAEALEMQLRTHGKSQASQPPLFEKLRQSLVFGDHEVFDMSDDENNDTGGDNDLPDFEQADFDLPHNLDNMDAEDFLHHEKQNDNTAHFDNNEAFGEDDLDPQTNLEDLCRSHLDALLASISETEKQTELATRVSTWKQRIEHTLEEEDSRPPFDIHLYGEKVMEKLSLEADRGGSMCFTQVVMGQTKHGVARTFSALLQLVNNGNVDLGRGHSEGETVCYTAANPFYIRLLGHEGRNEVQTRSSKKRVKSPLRKRCSKTDSSATEFTSLETPHQNSKFSVKLGKGSVVRCTPEGKRRRRSRSIKPVG